MTKLPTTTRLSRLGLLLFIVSFLAFWATAHAVGLTISPPRIVESVKPGKVVRGRIVIVNTGSRAMTLAARSVDVWFDAGAVVFHDGDPIDGSCRPMLSIDGTQVIVQPRDRFSFRWMIRTPTKLGECRLGIRFTVNNHHVATGDNLQVQISAAIITVMYINHGGKAVAVLEEVTPDYIRVTNTGNAHLRFDSMLNGIDADGNKGLVSVSESPVYPGNSRKLVLRPMDADFKPVSVSGVLYYKGGKLRIK